MNADYCARLEQGRERGPSSSPQPRRTAEPALKQLFDGYPDTPAFVRTPALDFLTANALAYALFSPFRRVDNLARMTFLDPAARGFHRAWSRAAEATVAALRHATGRHPHYPRLNDVDHRADPSGVGEPGEGDGQLGEQEVE